MCDLLEGRKVLIGRGYLRRSDFFQEVLASQQVKMYSADCMSGAIYKQRDPTTVRKPEVPFF